ncbi:hypothetical protein [Flavobacterium suaedae]|uniref:hypothetical protein n=1 Tax=Flavobacterium suaedae TaxID=1767027 RepID=UPI0016674A3C|nr:hypothetical protein [Flavobacterium suaedae]
MEIGVTPSDSNSGIHFAIPSTSSQVTIPLVVTLVTLEFSDVQPSVTARTL